MNEYFGWLISIAVDQRLAKRYFKLLEALFDTDFEWILALDENRAIDGIKLRNEYISELEKWGDIRKANEFNMDISGKPCSMLEMMIALAIRMSDMTEDADHDNRIEEWFWDMVCSLGLNDMDDASFDRYEVDSVLNRFLNRNYSSNGAGGLFTIEHPYRDLKLVDIWYQMNWYLDCYFNV